MNNHTFRSNHENPVTAIRLAGIVTLLANLQVFIYTSYIAVYLQYNLLTSIAIITVIGTLRNFIQLFFRVLLGELSQIIRRKLFSYQSKKGLL